jgi:hypothetical protein
MPRFEIAPPSLEELGRTTLMWLTRNRATGAADRRNWPLMLPETAIFHDPIHDRRGLPG